ncbi:MAG: ribosome rescue GTPase HflX [Acidiferrobacteraceae bacterium]
MPRSQRKTLETTSTQVPGATGEEVLLVHLRENRHGDDELEEFRLLATSAGASVGALVTGSRRRPDPATYLGRGKVEEIRTALITKPGVRTVLVNCELSPAQERNLERAVSRRVLDRTGLILSLFAKRARSHEGKLQVELAQLEHLATRLVRGWGHLERQKGGIGLRGPGETQLETDRRLVAERIKNLNRTLTKVRQQRLQRRKARRKVPIATVSLVGYTNAGKSSLFNALTGARCYTADRLFATLDPTMRRITLPGKSEAIITDTVGFIRRLPHRLVAAFHATLEEITEAQLLLHVVDAADPQRHEYIAQVERVLEEIGARHAPSLLIYNKVDQIGMPARCERDQYGRITRIWLSARTGDGLDYVLEALGEHLGAHRERHFIRLPLAAGRIRALVHQRLHVVSEQVLEDGWLFEVEMTLAEAGWLESQEDFRPEWLLDNPLKDAPSAVCAEGT